MAWVKLHDDILSDPKLLRAARAGRGGLVILPWLFAFAKKADDGGRLSVGMLPADADDIAHQLPGVASADVATGLESLVAIGVLAADPDGCLRFAKWEDRQAKPSDSREARRERQKRHRDRRRREEEAAREAVAPCHAPGALQAENGAVTPCHAAEQKRGEEKRKLQPRAAADDSTAAAPPPAPPSRSPAAPTGMDYTVRCAVALNTAMQANKHVIAFREIPASSLAGSVEWDRDGIDVEVAVQVIAARAAQFRPSPRARQVNSLKYFDAAVRERWAEVRATGADDRTRWPKGSRNAADAAFFKRQGYG